jgi:hypothetical protein
MELSDILKNDDPPKTEEPVQTELEIEKPPVETVKSSRAAHRAKEEEAQGRKRNPDGTFAPNEEPAKEEPKEEAKPEVKAEPKETPKEQPKVELTDKEKAFLADVQKERQKRQELERRLAAMQQQQQVQQPQPPAQPGQPATFWDNPEAALQQHYQQVQQTIVQNKVLMSADMARSKYPDFDEKVSAFVELMQTAPWLEQQVASSPNPAEMAYRIGKNRMELAQAGDLDSYRKKVEEETAARVRKEIEDAAAAKEAERQRLAASLPRTLSDVRGSSPKTQVWGGPTPLDSVLKH